MLHPFLLGSVSWCDVNQHLNIYFLAYSALIDNTWVGWFICFPPPFKILHFLKSLVKASATHPANRRSLNLILDDWEMLTKFAIT